MKRFLLILMIAATALLAVGCAKGGDQSNKETVAEPTTKLDTIPTTSPEGQPEWAPVDCDIKLESAQYVFAEGSDFQTFALVGNTDDNCELRFTLDVVTSGMLSQQDKATAYYLTLDGKKLNGTITFNDDFSEFSLKGGYSYNDLCALASQIRGL